MGNIAVSNIRNVDGLYTILVIEVGHVGCIEDLTLKQCRTAKEFTDGIGS
jgi:hypothetical protein